MQLMVDLKTESPAALRLCAQFLTEQAALAERIEGVAPVTDFNQADLDRVRQDMSAPLVPPAPIATVVPVVPVPPAPSIMTPSIVPPPVAPALASAPAPAPAVDEFDSSGIPFDGRIHQKGRAQKKDGTWKLQKGIADNIVAAVMQELAPRIKISVLEIPTPPNLTPSLVAGLAPLPVIPPAPPIPGPAASIPTPPAPVASIAPPSMPILDPFRALVRKITDAKNAGRISGEEVSQCVASAGAPSLQLLNNMPHLIPAVEANIDATLALR